MDITPHDPQNLQLTGISRWLLTLGECGSMLSPALHLRDFLGCRCIWRRLDILVHSFLFSSPRTLVNPIENCETWYCAIRGVCCLHLCKKHVYFALFISVVSYLVPCGVSSRISFCHQAVLTWIESYQLWTKVRKKIRTLYNAIQC